MIDTMQMVVGRIRMLLRGVSDIKLPDQTIVVVINQLLRGYLQQRKLRIRDHATQRELVTLSQLSIERDFQINISPDVEISALEYRGILNETMNVEGKVTLVPLSAFQNHVEDNNIVGSIYNDNLIRLNVRADAICGLTFIATFRTSLLAAVQLDGPKPPLPSDHLPMLEYQAAILCCDLTDDDSQEWVEWCARASKTFLAQLAEFKQGWIDYLESSTEPQEQPAQRSDRFGRGHTRTRAYVPLR